MEVGSVYGSYYETAKSYIYKAYFDEKMNSLYTTLHRGA